MYHIGYFDHIELNSGIWYNKYRLKMNIKFFLTEVWLDNGHYSMAL